MKFDGDLPVRIELAQLSRKTSPNVLVYMLPQLAREPS